MDTVDDESWRARMQPPVVRRRVRMFFVLIDTYLPKKCLPRCCADAKSYIYTRSCSTLTQGRPSRAQVEGTGAEPLRAPAIPNAADIEGEPEGEPEPQQQQLEQHARPRRQLVLPPRLADSHLEVQSRPQPQPQPQPDARVAASQQSQQRQQQQPQSRSSADQDAARHVRDLVKSDDFWQRLQLFADVSEPFVKLMRMVDSNVPCMGKLYHQFYMLTRFAEAVAGDPDAVADIEEVFFAKVLNVLVHKQLSFQGARAACCWRKACNFFTCTSALFLLFSRAEGPC